MELKTIQNNENILKSDKAVSEVIGNITKKLPSINLSGSGLSDSGYFGGKGIARTIFKINAPSILLFHTDNSHRANPLDFIAMHFRGLAVEIGDNY